MELERDSNIGGWLQLFAGLLIIPFSIAGFIWPHVLARGRNQFMARFVGAPISLLIGIVMVIEALKKFELL